MAQASPVRVLRGRSERRRRGGRLVGLADIGVGLLVFGVYLLVAQVARHHLGAARTHGLQLLRAERTLHLPAEAPLNRWAARHAVVAVLADYDYAIGYLVTTFGALFWVRFARPAAYPRALVGFLAVNLLSFAVFAGWPVTPPRLLGGGFVDTVERRGTVGSWGTGLVSTTANQHAAMPSLHVAWAVWLAVTLAAAGVATWVKVVAVLNELATVAVIVVTGNHFWLDAVAGLLLAWVVELAVRVWVRRGSPGWPSGWRPLGGRDRRTGGASAC